MPLPTRVRSLCLLAPLLLAACAKKPEVPAKEYHLHGTIVSLKPKNHSAVINADEIKGWMEAMTMEYPIKDSAEFAKLREGEVIDATVYVRDLDYEVGNIKEAK